MTAQLMNMVNEILNAEESIRLLELHEMSQSHMLGLHGFKRLHRYKACDRAKHSTMLRCFMTEFYHVEPSVNVTYTTPSNGVAFADHLKMMYDKSIAHIVTLKATAKMAFDESEDLLGGHLEEMICDQSHEAEKYYRLWMDVKRENADLNYISHELHEKMKKKERKDYKYKG